MTPREFNERLTKRARKASVSLDPQAVESLGAYYRLPVDLIAGIVAVTTVLALLTLPIVTVLAL